MRPFIIARDAFLITLLCLLLLAWNGHLSWWWLGVPAIAYGVLLALGATIIRWNFFIPAIHHGDRNTKLIALTFDDGPGLHTDAVLDVLREAGVPAAFFCIGKNAEAAPEMVLRMHNEGHIIGNHSYGHSFHFDWQGRNAMVAEILRTNDTIFAITGKTPRLFRPPYGVTNPELSHAVNLSGMTTVGWSLRSFDTTARDGGKLLKKIVSQTIAGDVILLHDRVALTAGILTAIIQGCRKKGFTFARLDQLINTDAYA